MRRIATALLVLAAAASGQQAIQSWDGSGNGMLRGDYVFRNTIWLVGNQRGDLSRALALYGVMNFDGNGNYSFTCRVIDSQLGTPQNCSTAPIPGIYRVSAAGFARIESLVTDNVPMDGLVANGVLIASSTEVGVNDLLIATQTRSDPATAATLNGKFWTAAFDTPSSNITAARDALFAMNFDGAGNVGTVDATGYIGANSNAVTQSVPGVRYSFTNGIGTLTFGGTLTASNLIAGSREFYVSQDGNFIFGGQINGFDMMVGVRAVSGDAPASLFGGLYYQAGITADGTQFGRGFTNWQTYYSSFLSNGSTVVGHQRIFSLAANGSFSYTYLTPYTLNSDGTYEDAKNDFRYVVGQGGGLQVGIGKGPVLGLNVVIKPGFAGPGVYLNPGLILNAASFVPSTSGVSRGELITLVGTNLASAAMIDSSFPTSLGGVLVLINSRPAPIYEVGPNRITVQVPFSITEPTAVIQVVSNGQPSNNIMLFVNRTTPGVFLINGTYAAALHADFSVVTPQNPARPGETIQVFVTGLGDVNPAVSAGVPAPSDPLSRVTSFLSAFIDGREGTAQFIGLAPGLIGLYQINVEVPANTASGDVTFELGTADSFHSSALLPVASP
jgi:uncharacterized protein (TIGR03437 family)